MIILYLILQIIKIINLIYSFYSCEVIINNFFFICAIGFVYIIIYIPSYYKALIILILYYILLVSMTVKIKYVQVPY